VARGLRLSVPGRLWTLVGTLLALPALAVGTGPGLARQVLTWQPALAGAEPWRCWSAAWVHFSPLHLGANLAGALMLLLLGSVARLPHQAAVAWALAWPLTHLALLGVPALVRYGGLSGVLHAGVAVAAVVLVRQPGRPPAERWLGAALGLGALAKALSERPWGAVVVHPAGWDIAVAPVAHACGLACGLLAAAAMPLPRVGLRSRSSSPARPPGSSAG
jgi:rhomboid family GlyGly-CTERM serine protease